MQYARWVRLRNHIGCIPRNDWEKDMSREVVLNEILHRCPCCLSVLIFGIQIIEMFYVLETEDVLEIPSA